MDLPNRPLVGLAACLATETAGAVRFGSGYWSQFVIAGLTGASPPADDSDPGTAVSAEEIFFYTVPLTQQFSLDRRHATQTPVMYDPDNSIELDITGTGPFRGVFIANYDYPGTEYDLTSPPNSRDGLVSALKSYGGWSSSPIRLVNNVRADSIAGDLEHILKDAQTGDVVLFYYAGHGNTMRDNDGDEAVRHAGDVLDETIWGVDRWNLRDDAFERIIGEQMKPDTRLVVMIEACHSGGTAEGAAASSVTRLDAQADEIECPECCAVPGAGPVVLVICAMALAGVGAWMLRRQHLGEAA
jgi:hypothetical protein